MKKNYKEFLFTLFIIIVFFYTIYYYFGLSLKANDEILKIDLRFFKLRFILQNDV